MPESTELSPALQDVKVFACTVVQLQSFLELMLVGFKEKNVPTHLMESAAASMYAQIRCDLAFHPETVKALDDYNNAREKEDV